MKKQTMITIIMLIFLSSPVYAKDTGFYVGIGGNYAFQNFDTTDINRDLGPYGIQIKFGNSYGLNAKVGYRFNRLFSTECAYDYFPDFSWNQAVVISDANVTFNAKTEIMTFSISGKLSPDFGHDIVRPYVAIGGGLMHGKIEVKEDVSKSGVISGFVASRSSSSSDPFVKIGGGIDFYVAKSVSIGVEGSYIFGLGSLDEIRYSNVNWGVAYHF